MGSETPECNAIKVLRLLEFSLFVYVSETKGTIYSMILDVTEARQKHTSACVHIAQTFDCLPEKEYGKRGLEIGKNRVQADIRETAPCETDPFKPSLT